MDRVCALAPFIDNCPSPLRLAVVSEVASCCHARCVCVSTSPEPVYAGGAFALLKCKAGLGTGGHTAVLDRMLKQTLCMCAVTGATVMPQAARLRCSRCSSARPAWARAGARPRWTAC